MRQLLACVPSLCLLATMNTMVLYNVLSSTGVVANALDEIPTGTTELSAADSMTTKEEDDASQRILDRRKRRRERARRRRLKQEDFIEDTSKLPILHAKGILKQAQGRNSQNPTDIMTVERVQDVIEEHRINFQQVINRYHRSYEKHLPDIAFLPKADYDILPNGELIVWKGKHDNELVFSAYDSQHTKVLDRPMDLNQDVFVPPEVGAAWTDNGGYHIDNVKKYGEKFEPDYMSKIGKITDIEGHHVFWGVFYQGIFAHLLLDYIAYFSFLKDHLPPHVKILILDTGKDGRAVRNMLEKIDPKFVEDHVTFVACAGPDAVPFKNKSEEIKFTRMSRQGVMCHDQLIRVHRGSLIVTHPKTFHRHIEYITSAREWIKQNTLGAHKSEQEDRPRDKVIFHTRSPLTALETSLEAGEDAFRVAKELQSSINPHDAGVGHGRVMNLQEDIMLVKLLQREIDRYNEKEANRDDQRQLVLFDGTLPLEESIELFQSAKIVIGPHGGGMANIFFLLENDSAGSINSDTEEGEEDLEQQQDRNKVKVLEFITSAITPNVQEGVMHRTYFYMYNTAPWIDEYHHIFYTPPSSDYGDAGTFVNLDDYQDALKSIFRPKKKKNAMEKAEE